jgi:pimeloyl-ACP methyl ester carboxylesterase
MAVATAAFAGGRALAQTTRGAAMPIDEGEFVNVNGYQQWIAIRGRDVRNPVLLFLNGGPGLGTASTAPLFEDWEKDFTMVLWDQPAGGGTSVKGQETGKGDGPLTIKRYVDDALTVAEWARGRLHKRQIALFGISWGTLLGLEMIHRRPDLFFAYAGTSQVVGPRGATVGYEMALKAARERGDAKAVEALQKVGPPPYARFEDFITRQSYVVPPGQPMTPAEKARTADMMKAFAAGPPPDARYVAYHQVPPGYDGVKVFLDTQRQLFQETWAWDAHHLGTSFKVPVFIFQGDNDINTPYVVAKDYFNEITAPKKAFETIAGASHNTMPFHDELLALLERYVLPLAPRA